MLSVGKLGCSIWKVDRNSMKCSEGDDKNVDFTFLIAFVIITCLFHVSFAHDKLITLYM